jgi:hypothetical protein
MHFFVLMQCIRFVSTTTIYTKNKKIMETIGQKTLKIGLKEFKALMIKAKCLTGLDLEDIGFEAESRKYYILFNDEDGNLTTEFAMYIKKEWVQVKPTKEQIVMMHEMVLAKALEINATNTMESNTSYDNETPYHPYNYAI